MVRGIVQGAGFRPFVYGLAARLRLGGFVKNQTGSVLIEVEGEAPALDRFGAELAGRPPPLALIEHLSWERRPPRGEPCFRIEASEADGASPVFLSPDAVAEAVAPGNPWLGVMLPYTPLHHLLLRAVGGTPLVMTSGNRADEPIAYQDDAPAKLAGIADLFLVHDRPIHVRCDDSVTRVVDGDELPVRRSRGYAPRPLDLPLACPRPLLAVGGQFKATFALGRGRQAFLSHHLGDLDHYDAYRAFERDVALYEQLFAVRPECVAHDLHPDYATTRYARKRTVGGTELLAVQHHHAHMASCMAENGLNEPVLGMTFDGTGYGTDGAVWGGEFLVGDYRDFRRGAHLRYVGMPGGDQAIREPWRMAVAHLTDARAEFAPLRARLLPVQLRTVERMLERRLNTPLTSSMGRLFDAVAALAGVRDRVSHEGQAAVELEWLATGAVPDRAYPFAIGPPPPARRQRPWSSIRGHSSGRSRKRRRKGSPPRSSPGAFIRRWSR